MRDPAQTLLGELERIVSALPGRVAVSGPGRGRAARFEAAMGCRRRRAWRRSWRRTTAASWRPTCASWPSTRPRRRAAGGARGLGAARWQVGLWPVVERAGRRYALDAEEASSDGEWPVVEVSEHGVDRVGTSFLRFLHVLCAELAAGGVAGDARRRARARALPARSRARRSLAGSGRAARAGGRASRRSTPCWPPRCAPRRRRRRR